MQKYRHTSLHFLLSTLLFIVSVNFLYATPAFEPIEKEKQSIVIKKLSKENHVTTKGMVAMGFEKDSTSTYVSIIRLNSQGNSVKDTYKISDKFYKQIKNNKSASKRSSTDIRKQKVNQDGRIYFIAHNTIKSTYVYPMNIHNIIEDISPSAMTGITLLTYSGTIYGSYKFTENMELGYGRVATMNYGGELGITYSALSSVFLESLIDKDNNKDNFPALKFNAWTTILSFPTGIYAGSRIKHNKNIEYGNIATIRFLGRSGLAYGFLLPTILPDDYRENHYSKISTGLSIGLIPTGIWLGQKLTKDKHISSGRSFLIETTGIMGGITGALIPAMCRLNYSNKNTGRLTIATTLAGHGLGTLLGLKFKKQNRYSFGQGIFMAVSATGTAALTVALPLVANLKFKDYYNIYDFLGVTGAWGGLVLGESLSHTIFDKIPLDNKAQSKISFPILQQLPFALVNWASKDGEKEIPILTIFKYQL